MPNFYDQLCDSFIRPGRQSYSPHDLGTYYLTQVTLAVLWVVDMTGHWPTQEDTVYTAVIMVWLSTLWILVLCTCTVWMAPDFKVCGLANRFGLCQCSA